MEFADILANSKTNEDRPYLAAIKPQYDAYGYDTGLYIIFDEYDTPVLENISLMKGENNRLVIGQFQEWDNESYTEDGEPDGTDVEFGSINFCYPLDDEYDAGRVLAFIEHYYDQHDGGVEWLY